jgi:hypothetical protein
VRRLSLQFDIRDLPVYAAHFPSGGDNAVLAIGRAARQRGHYTKSEFRTACRWKTARSGPLVARNTASEVRRATRIALDDHSDDTERMRALRELRGVDWATASVLLHVADPDSYPILDVRALHALGIRRRISYGYRLWLEYVAVYRELVARSGLDGRTVDRGLWQWSAEQSGRVTSRA